MLIDLQLHSTYSDGYLSPTELVKFIKSKGIKVASLTDHNTVAGLHEFRHACRANDIKSIIGLELYVRFGHTKFNLLWYNFDDDNPELHNMLRKSQIRRRRSVRKILNKLEKLGFVIDEKILDKYTHYVPINKIVDEFSADKENMKRMKKELGVGNIREEDIIAKYFQNSEIGSISPSYIDFKKIIELKKKIGGQLVLCHPGKYSGIKKEVIERLKEKGLDGIELLSPHHSYRAVCFFQQLARDLNLIETGGSDFHCYREHGHIIQHALQYYKIKKELLWGVDKIIENNNKK